MSATGVYAFPTCVGMNRGLVMPLSHEERVPYMCGDEPVILVKGGSRNERSLHVWG